MADRRPLTERVESIREKWAAKERALAEKPGQMALEAPEEGDHE